MSRKSTPNKTNLQEVISTAKLLYYAVPVKPDEQFPFIVCHPFVQSSVVPLEGYGMELFDITEEENEKRCRDMWFKRFDNADSVSKIYCHVAKAWRLTFLKFAKDHLSKELFSELLADAWVSSENPNDDKNCSLKELVSWFKKADKRRLMSEADYKIYDALPDTFTVYRGVGIGRVKDGLSWTRNLKTAEWFANRWGKKGYVQKAEISKEYALAYLNSRGEDEVVVDVFAIKNKIVRMESKGDMDNE